MYPTSSRLRRPKVLKVSPELRHEQGPGFDQDSQRVAVVAHWSERPQLSRSVQALLRELTQAGYTCALVSTAQTPEPLQFSDDGLAGAVSVFRRPNIGYDFGSWAVFLAAHDRVRTARRVILANDSLVGPFAPMTEILHGFDVCGTDLWALTNSTQDCPHLQSYLTGFTDGVLARKPLRDFWDGIRVQPSKRHLIRAYEMGLSRLARRKKLTTSACFPWRSVAQKGQNPTSLGWRRLILSGFPFVKRELVVAPPPEVPDVTDVPRVVRQTWGEDVFQWI